MFGFSKSGDRDGRDASEEDTTDGTASPKGFRKSAASSALRRRRRTRRSAGLTPAFDDRLGNLARTALLNTSDVYDEEHDFGLVNSNDAEALTKSLKDVDTEAVEEAEAEARKKAEAEAHKKAEAEAHKKAEAEAHKKAEAEAHKKAEAEARKKTEAEAREKAEVETRKKAEAGARKKAEAESLKKRGQHPATNKAPQPAAAEKLWVFSFDDDDDIGDFDDLGLLGNPWQPPSAKKSEALADDAATRSPLSDDLGNRAAYSTVFNKNVIGVSEVIEGQGPRPNDALKFEFDSEEPSVHDELPAAPLRKNGTNGDSPAQKLGEEFEFKSEPGVTEEPPALDELPATPLRKSGTNGASPAQELDEDFTLASEAAEKLPALDQLPATSTRKDRANGASAPDERVGELDEAFTFVSEAAEKLLALDEPPTTPLQEDKANGASSPDELVDELVDELDEDFTFVSDVAEELPVLDELPATSTRKDRANGASSLTELDEDFEFEFEFESKTAEELPALDEPPATPSRKDRANGTSSAKELDEDFEFESEGKEELTALDKPPAPSSRKDRTNGAYSEDEREDASIASLISKLTRPATLKPELQRRRPSAAKPFRAQNLKEATANDFDDDDVAEHSDDLQIPDLSPDMDEHEPDLRDVELNEIDMLDIDQQDEDDDWQAQLEEALGSQRPLEDISAVDTEDATPWFDDDDRSDDELPALSDLSETLAQWTSKRSPHPGDDDPLPPAIAAIERTRRKTEPVYSPSMSPAETVELSPEQLTLAIIANLPRLRRFAAAQIGDEIQGDRLVQKSLETTLANPSMLQQAADFGLTLIVLLRRKRRAMLSDVSVLPRTTEEAHAFEKTLCQGLSGADQFEIYQFTRAINGLAEEDRALLLMVALENCSYVQIATLIRVSNEDIMEKIARARLRLRHAQSHDDDDDDDGLAMADIAPHPREVEIHGYLDGELDPDHMAEIDALVENDDDAADRLLLYGIQGDLIRRVYAPLLNRQIPGPLLDAVASAAKPKRKGFRFLSR